MLIFLEWITKHTAVYLKFFKKQMNKPGFQSIVIGDMFVHVSVSVFFYVTSQCYQILEKGTTIKLQNLSILLLVH